ncbi:MAG: hypothetical protein JNK75_04650 [Betaproteobacteria bacterium]|nr:hypothetical protein [Betaproteobacteria bacterium]
MKTIKLALVSLLMGCFATVAVAQDAKPYKDGTVTNLQYLRTKPGKYDEYMRYLAGDYKKVMDAQVKAGNIVRWGVYTTQTRTPEEGNIILTVTYANMAALDKADERDAVATKILGSEDVRTKAGVARGAMRDLIGGQLIREITFK